jgi:hypothetical protein
MRGLARVLALSVEEPLREMRNPVIRLTMHEATTKKILNLILIWRRFLFQISVVRLLRSASR